MSKILGAGSAYAAAKEMPYCSNMSISANLVVELVERIAELEKENVSLNEQNKRVCSEIAELENQWISVEDKLPDELQSVLSFSSYDGVFQSIYRAGNFKKTLVVWEHLNVTHWMPLPSPPKEQVK